MTRLAFAGWCSGFTTPVPAKSRGLSSELSPSSPTPAIPWRKNARRQTSLIPGDRFMQVEDCAGDHRGRGEMGAMEIVATAGGVFALGEIHPSKITVGFVGTDARSSEVINQEAGDGKGDVVHGLGVDTEAGLAREQTILGIAFVERAFARRGLSI